MVKPWFSPVKLGKPLGFSAFFHCFSMPRASRTVPSWGRGGPGAHGLRVDRGIRAGRAAPSAALLRRLPAAGRSAGSTGGVEFSGLVDCGYIFFWGAWGEKVVGYICITWRFFWMAGLFFSRGTPASAGTSAGSWPSPWMLRRRGFEWAV